MDPFTEPGTLDLTQRLPTIPGWSTRSPGPARGATSSATSRSPTTPLHDATYCGCGFVTYPGDHGELPLPRVIHRRGASVTDPAWTYGQRRAATR
jgi:hypothetical protein